MHNLLKLNCVNRLLWMVVAHREIFHRILNPAEYYEAFTLLRLNDYEFCADQTKWYYLMICVWNIGRINHLRSTFVKIKQTSICIRTRETRDTSTFRLVPKKSRQSKLWGKIDSSQLKKQIEMRTRQKTHSCPCLSRAIDKENEKSAYRKALKCC